MRRMGRIIFALSGVVPILALFGTPADTTFLLYSFFVLAYFMRQRYAKVIALIPLSPRVKFVLLTALFGLLTEGFAWFSNYNAARVYPLILRTSLIPSTLADAPVALFHPQLVPDVLLGFGFYVGCALAWALIIGRYRWSIVSVFVTMGVFGITREQNAAILVAMVQYLFVNPLFSLLLGAYVFVVYGSFVGLAYIPFADTWGEQGRSGRLKYVLVIALLYLLGNLVFLLFAVIFNALDWIPEMRNIVAYPFS